jgi:hypothetical protein
VTWNEAAVPCQIASMQLPMHICRRPLLGPTARQLTRPPVRCSCWEIAIGARGSAGTSNWTPTSLSENLDTLIEPSIQFGPASAAFPVGGGTTFTLTTSAGDVGSRDDRVGVSAPTGQPTLRDCVVALDLCGLLSSVGYITENVSGRSVL